MANTYTQIYVHFVFVVKQRVNLINKSFNEELYKYITGIVQNKGHKLIAINGMSDHIHVLTGMKPSQSISDLARDIKANSGSFINSKKLTKGRFEWQLGFAAFSYSHSQIDRVIKYIINQEEHHRKLTFKEEYIKMMKAYNVKFDEKYLFDN